jgi:hypothetical protein
MNFNNILFLDIETVSQAENYNHLDDEWKELWDHKAKSFLRTTMAKAAKKCTTGPVFTPSLERSFASPVAVYREVGRIRNS